MAALLQVTSALAVRSSRHKSKHEPEQLNETVTGRANLQGLLHHPRMPRYLTDLYGELNVRQRGGTVLTWDAASLVAILQARLQPEFTLSQSSLHIWLSIFWLVLVYVDYAPKES